MARLEPSASMIINSLSGIANWLDHYLLLPHRHHVYTIVVPCKAVLPVIIPADYRFRLDKQNSQQIRSFVGTWQLSGPVSCDSGVTFGPKKQNHVAARSHQNRKPRGAIGEALQGGHEMLNHLGNVIRVTRRTIRGLNTCNYLRRHPRCVLQLFPAFSGILLGRMAELGSVIGDRYDSSPLRPCVRGKCVGQIGGQIRLDK